MSERSSVLKARMRALTKKYSWEIIADLRSGKKNLTQVSEDNRIPYATVQRRIAELEAAGLVSVRDELDDKSGRPVKEVRVEEVKIEIDPDKILRIVRMERGPIIERV
jgi:predicted ArsR family transcriptional regulator